MAMTGKKRPLIIGPKSDDVLVGALTVASGGWAIGVPVDYFQWQDWGHVLGLFVLFRIVVASTLERRRLS
jgi:cadmium resistance protein CadD (predicted permease)